MNAATATSNLPEPIVLVFPNHVRTAGDLLTGYVDLNMPLAQQKGVDQVRVKLRGAAQSRTTVGNTACEQTEWLVRDDLMLWTPGSAFPAPDTHVLRLPFTFQLPDTLPPSFHYIGGGIMGRIGYSVEVVGHRPGRFTRNRRVGCVFPLLPVADPLDVSTRMDLLSGWNGNWKKIEVGKDIRQGLFGQYSHVEIEISLPDITSFPFDTPLPFRMHIMTRTKDMKHADVEAMVSKGKELFPAPPLKPISVLLRLHKLIRAEANAQKLSSTQHGPNLIPKDSQFNVSEPEWIVTSEKNGEELGQLQRVVELNTMIAFTSSPTFSTALINCQYSLYLKVPFVGLTNSIKHEFPLVINSGLGNASVSLETDKPPPAFDFQSLDLPPSYYTGEDHDWDEKS